MNLYKVTVNIGYANSDYLVLANDETQASKYTMEVYGEWYCATGSCVRNIKLIAEEGKYANTIPLLNATQGKEK